MHKRESYLSSNTGRLAKNTLPNCKIHLRGDLNNPLDWDSIIPIDKQTYFLFPSEDAISVSELKEIPREKLHFIVPDGSWNQAKKVHKREDKLKDIQCVKLEEKNYISNYHCRKQPKPNFLCTYESMGKVIESLEGDSQAEFLEKNLKALSVNSLKNRRHFSGKILELNT
tara:strand:- start:584 stop:1093 length:510 start_codon:yes stop_codon:yes gene_type:complete